MIVTNWDGWEIDRLYIGRDGTGRYTRYKKDQVTLTRFEGERGSAPVWVGGFTMENQAASYSSLDLEDLCARMVRVISGIKNAESERITSTIKAIFVEER